jgi:hypothetical protein
VACRGVLMRAITVLLFSAAVIVCVVVTGVDAVSHDRQRRLSQQHVLQASADASVRVGLTLKQSCDLVSTALQDNSLLKKGHSADDVGHHPLDSAQGVGHCSERPFRWAAGRVRCAAAGAVPYGAKKKPCEQLYVDSYAARDTAVLKHKGTVRDGTGRRRAGPAGVRTGASERS